MHSYDQGWGEEVFVRVCVRACSRCSCRAQFREEPRDFVLSEMTSFVLNLNWSREKDREGEIKMEAAPVQL